MKTDPIAEIQRLAIEYARPIIMRELRGRLGV